jgi:hypothetical protein
MFLGLSAVPSLFYQMLSRTKHVPSPVPDADTSLLLEAGGLEGEEPSLVNVIMVAGDLVLKKRKLDEREREREREEVLAGEG